MMGTISRLTYRGPMFTRPFLQYVVKIENLLSDVNQQNSIFDRRIDATLYYVHPNIQELLYRHMRYSKRGH